VSLKANAGDVISIIGSSGSGKSTWLRCINFLEQPTSGKIIVAGEEVKLLPGTKDALKVADQKQLQRDPHPSVDGLPALQSVGLT
jgi:ABC-type histidine transport system ATPase subunit